MPFDFPHRHVRLSGTGALDRWVKADRRGYLRCAMGRLLIFDISGGELMLILVVVLMFFGSKGIPGIARTL